MNVSPATSGQRIFLLDCIELLAAIFRGPEARTCAGMIVEGIPQLVSTNPMGRAHLIAALKNLQACLPGPDAGQAVVEIFCEELEPDYVRLFINAGGGVLVSLYESCHTSADGAVMGPAALRMRDLLQEAGLEVAGASNEPPDHLSMELEYLYHQLSSFRDGEGDAVPEHVEHFASSVMLPWVRPFEAALAEADPKGFFHRSASLLVAVLETIADD